MIFGESARRRAFVSTPRRNVPLCPQVGKKFARVRAPSSPRHGRSPSGWRTREGTQWLPEGRARLTRAKDSSSNSRLFGEAPNGARGARALPRKSVRSDEAFLLPHAATLRP